MFNLKYDLMLGDCLERMKELEPGSVDLVLTDPPYGTSACKWDSVIPLAPMWEQVKRVLVPSGVAVMTASQPFTTTLISSNLSMFKYCWVWEKNRLGGFFDVKFRPLKAHEDVVVFSNGGSATGSRTPMKYNPQGVVEIKPKKRTDRGVSSNVRTPVKAKGSQTKSNYPKTVLKISNEFKTVHSTQKPVALMEYLIKTYTNEGDTVLDFAMGSGTTGVACRNLKRNFIGIELDEKYYNIATSRIEACHV